MKLPRTSVEYARWIVTADVPLGGPIEVSLTELYNDAPSAASWVPLEWEGDSGTTRTARLLLAGPGAPAVPGAHVLTRPGTWWSWIRLQDLPEVVVRRAGRVEVL